MENVLFFLKNNQLAKLKESLMEENPVDIAELFEDLTKEQSLKIFRILPKDTSAEVFSYLSSEKQQEIVENITDEEIRHIIDEMFIDDTVDFIEEMPANVVDKILQNTSPDTRKLINQFLKYPENSAGSVMTVEYVSLKSDMNIGQALNHIKKVGIDNETIDICYIIDNQRKLVGFISLKSLIFLDDILPLVDAMETNVISAITTDDQEFIASQFRKYDLTSMPVVDNEGRLVGIITIDDVVDVIDQENTEDFQKMAAMNPSDEEYLKESVFSLAKHRIIWLLVLMISATATGTIIRRYEEVLQSVVILAAFIPMLMDTGGNAGSQSSTLIIRGIALGEIQLKDIGKILWKEFRVSLIVGITLAAVNFLRIYYIDRAGLTISLVVCASLLFTVVIAKVVGGVLPIMAKAFKLDPAIMASPLITTIVDACALVVYFGLSTHFLNLA
ncbi:MULTISPECIES: magnesium transporter [Fusobacterium]|jgi:magnesium transporter|uniref:Magnesium transporter MgtE n=1 Tax=Fusobacterium varium ATCC 27725 TaxID=469618 RepID=A0ABM6U7V8_FUSVA|nr:MULTISPECIES: magnesium transporter [Fusobacterium]AVQ32498.1 magnesium transporter [Fusobacterium varium ATCC 27725]EES64440.1 magnesium transporter [Fusobacterium varium ATCC 27725]MCF0169907.1 magnesium transporter [Fusobacterium varium]MCF2672845.1 magnesium transporter [Fusobacterium varium]MCI6033760.1 magnesium transporter [Fusobacterium varium]